MAGSGMIVPPIDEASIEPPAVVVPAGNDDAESIESVEVGAPESPFKSAKDVEEFIQDFFSEHYQPYTLDKLYGAQAVRMWTEACTRAQNECSVPEVEPKWLCLLGVCYLEGRGGLTLNTVYAAESFQRASDRDFPLGHCMWAFCLHQGLGVAKDEMRGIRLYMRAVQMGCGLAELRLGALFLKGFHGIEPDDQRSFTLVERAARRGLSAAQKLAAVMYERGKGVEKNPKLSMFWLKKAIAQGEPGGKQAMFDIQQTRVDNEFLQCCNCRVD
jgi:TPR repeat protein